MLQKSLVAIVLLTALFICSCQNEITIPKPCTDEPNFPFTTVQLQVVTEVTSNNKIFVDKRGYLMCDSIRIKGNGISRRLQISGYMCSAQNFFVQIVYTDTADVCGIKAEGTLAHNVLDGTIYYCPNINNNCQYERAGSISATYSGCQGIGNFSMMQFSGGFGYNCGMNEADSLK